MFVLSDDNAPFGPAGTSLVLTRPAFSPLLSLLVSPVKGLFYELSPRFLMQAHIIYENDDWMPPLRQALDAAQVPYDEWFIHDGHFDVTEAPPEGVFLNRMSASSHTRGHTASVEHTRQLIAWLERHGRRVINGLHAFELEISKVQQHAALEQAGIRTPATRAVSGGSEALLAAAQDFPTPFITKHNRGGKGLGVQLFRTFEAFEAAKERAADEDVDHDCSLRWETGGQSTTCESRG